MSTSPRRAKPSDSEAKVRKAMVAAQIRHMPYVDESGRVVGLAVLAESGGEGLEGHWVVLMAGGLGTRLRPLTDDMPKPMLRVGDKPLLETIIESFRRHGFRNFYLSVNYKADVVTEHFGDGAALGVNIRYLREDTSLGTAGALGLIEDRPQRPLIVMNGDVLTSVDFGSLLDYHREHRAMATMAVREYDVQVPFGVVRVDGHSILGIDEKPVHRFFVNAGIYVIEPDVLDLVERGVRIDMPDLFQKMLDRSLSLSVFPIREYWLDIGRIGDFERANVDWHKPAGGAA
jgi:NDP-sugar pyrophosphorylase family protein